MCEELFGPVLTMYVYNANDFEQALALVDQTSAYALTGSVIAHEREAIIRATERLRHSAGNFYVNDKPTGAVVGQQPFGGARASGTNGSSGYAVTYDQVGHVVGRQFPLVPHQHCVGVRVIGARFASQMRLKLASELLHESNRGHGCGITQRAERAAQHGLGQVLNQLDVFLASAAGVHARQRLLQPRRALAAGDAPAAAFVRVELHQA